MIENYSKADLRHIAEDLLSKKVETKISSALDKGYNSDCKLFSERTVFLRL